tara:strand:+ start:2195 stop:2512 length:318 start_codon:yes stop_codon:yes gene_type:complete
MTRISDSISLELRRELFSQSRWNTATPLDLIRKQVKGEEYAEELMEIRMMSKQQLINYINKTEANKAVIVAKQIKDNYWYRNYVDNSIKAKVELLNYAYNRKNYI